MKSEGKGENLIRQKSYDFTLQVIEMSRGLVRANEFMIPTQLLRLMTSVGANVEEAQSRADFAVKMSIVSKEARKSHYWLRLQRDSNSVSPGLCKHASERGRINCENSNFHCKVSNHNQIIQNQEINIE